MSKRELVNTLFYIAYHSDNMRLEVRKFLFETFPLVESKHLSALYHFLDVLRDSEDNNNPMIYGMINEAWKQLLDEQMPI